MIKLISIIAFIKALFNYHAYDTKFWCENFSKLDELNDICQVFTQSNLFTFLVTDKGLCCHIAISINLICQSQ